MDMKKFLEELETLVNIDCGSYTPEGVNLQNILRKN